MSEHAKDGDERLCRVGRREVERHRVHRRLTGLAQWVMVVFYCAVLFVVSSSSSATGPVGRTGIPDPMWHAILFAPLGALLYACIARTWKGWRTVVALGLTMMIGMSYALFDEIHQEFVPGRGWDPTDLAGDAAGLLLGGALVSWVFGRRK